MFLGKYTTYFSGKNRLMLPKKIRRELGNEDKFYIILGRDGEVWGLDKDNWAKLVESILEKPLSLEAGGRDRRSFFSQADECFLDRQGRFILPQECVDKCDLRGEVWIIGAGDHFEIWSKKRWEEELIKIKAD